MEKRQNKLQSSEMKTNEPVDDSNKQMINNFDFKGDHWMATWWRTQRRTSESDCQVTAVKTVAESSLTFSSLDKHDVDPK